MFKSFLFFVKVANVNYSDRMVLSNLVKILEKTCEGVYLISEVAD